MNLFSWHWVRPSNAKNTEQQYSQCPLQEWGPHYNISNSFQELPNDIGMGKKLQCINDFIIIIIIIRCNSSSSSVTQLFICMHG